MALDKFLHKAKKAATPKSHAEKVLELKAQMTYLSSTLDALITENLLQVQKAQRENKSNHRAENRIKNAYYTRMVLESAKEDLEEVENDNQLARVINKTSRTLFRLNSMAEFSPKIGESFLKWQAETLGERNVENATKEAIPTKESEQFTVPGDLLERLLGGETISECLEGDRDFLEGDYSFTPAMAEGIQDIDKQFEDIVKDMKRGV